MIVLGLLLLLASSAVALGVVLSNTDSTSAEVFGLTVSNITLGGLFLAGVVVGLVFMLGLAVLVAGAGRKRRRRLKTRHTVRDVRTEKEQLAEENTALRARLTDPDPAQVATSEQPKAPTSDADSRPDRMGMFDRN